MKLLERLALAGLMLALPTGVFAAEVKIALDGPPDLEKSGSYVWAHSFAQALEARGLEARELPRDAVGGEAEKLDQATMGLLEVSLSDVNSVVRLDPFIVGVRLPYLFDDVDHLDRTLAEGEVLDRVNESLASAGVRLLALVPLGPPSGILNTRRPILQPADMADLRMRALDEAQIALYQAWGSSGTIVSWAEVPNALQTGVAHGYLNTGLIPLIFGHTDFIRYFTDAGVINALRAVIASEDWYRSLSEAEREAVEEAVVVANRANRDWLAEMGPQVLADLEAAGVEVTQLTPEARMEFRALSAQVYDAGLLSPEQVETWVGLAERAR